MTDVVSTTESITSTQITALVTHTVARWSLYARAGKVAEVGSYDPVSDIF